MSNIQITNIDNGSLVMRGAEFRDDVITFAGADTYVEGTILARDSVSDKLVAFVKGGVTNEDGIPKAVLNYDVEAAGAGDVAVRVLVEGTVNKGRLVIDADGDASNVDDVVLDELRDYGIVGLDVQELNILDNQ